MSSTLKAGALGFIAGRTQARGEDGSDDEEDVAGAGPSDDTEAKGDTPEDEAEGDAPEEESEGDDDDAYAEGEEDEEPAMRAAYRRGATAERSRIEAILTAEASAAVPELAADLAFTRTHIATADAVAMMQAAASGKPGSAQGDSLSARMARHKSGVRPAPAPKAKGAEGMAERIHAASLAAIEKRAGKRS